MKAVEDFIAEKGYVEGLTKERADGFFRFVKAPLENQKEIAEKAKELFSL